ncbi:MAG: proton-conducting transporter membrane subunit [Corynebacterium sp.]|uniref:complex I subunit 5 family protein n=1 Tax=Corynebacterium sp. TaxID=1720 RepID=UPI0026DFA581|nr:proton-conducting transporter membrane subunit [Corynebacterium sp.]MDO5669256.1 proton-conducting transporter membrane subunit [Corynebacterium sp.]
MTLAQFSLGGLVLLPLLAGALAVYPRLGRPLGLSMAGILPVLLAPLLISVTRGPVELTLGGYDAPLGITLRADGLSLLFLLLTAVVGGLVTLAARRERGFWPLWLGCWAGLNAVFVSGDLFNTYVGLEVVGLTAVGLVALGGPQARLAALRYLFVAVAGSLLFLVSVGLLVAVTGTLDIAQVAQRANEHPEVLSVALILATIGLGMKLALAPMHGWLIPAHAAAPSPVSPLLSALVIKAAFFVLLRLWLWVATPELVAELAVLTWILAGAGVLAIVVGSVMALRQTHMKPLVAYSTVAQVGYFFLFFPLIPNAAAIPGALAGTLGLALGHGIAKAALFLAAGYLKELYGTDEIARLHGVGRDHPGLILAMGLAAVGLAGMPLSLSFSGKWLLSTAAVGNGHYWLLAVVVVATLLSAAYLLKLLGPLLVEEEIELERTSSLPAIALAPPLALGTLTLLSGFGGVWLMKLLEVGAPW